VIAKIPSTSLPELKRWASLARLAKASQLVLETTPNSVIFSMSSGYGARSASLYTRFSVEAEILDSGECSTNPTIFFQTLATIEGEYFIVSFDGTEVSLTDESSCCFALNALGEAHVMPLAADDATVLWQAKLPADRLATLMSRALTCLGKESEYYTGWTKCLHIRTRGAQLEMESCDGFMLSRVHGDAEIQGEGEALITGSIAKVIARLLPEDGEVTLKRHEKVFTVEAGNMLVQVSVADATYPDSDGIGAPSRGTATTTVTLSIPELKAIAERIIVLSKEGNAQDNLELAMSQEEVRTSFTSEGVGSFKNTLEAEVTGEDVKVILGATMVRTILAAMDSDKVHLYINHPEKAIRLEPAVESPWETYVMMPRSSHNTYRAEAKQPTAS